MKFASIMIQMRDLRTVSYSLEQKRYQAVLTVKNLKKKTHRRTFPALLF